MRLRRPTLVAMNVFVVGRLLREGCTSMQSSLASNSLIVLPQSVEEIDNLLHWEWDQSKTHAQTPKGKLRPPSETWNAIDPNCTMRTCSIEEGSGNSVVASIVPSIEPGCVTSTSLFEYKCKFWCNNCADTWTSEVTRNSENSESLIIQYPYSLKRFGCFAGKTRRGVSNTQLREWYIRMTSPHNQVQISFQACPTDELVRITGCKHKTSF